MEDDRPIIADYPNTPEGRHIWAQAMLRWNDLHGVRSEDLVAQWNAARKRM